MSIVETINRNPAITIPAVVLLIAACVWFTAKSSTPAGPGTELYFTTDDGQTWFADQWSRVTPFETGGKTAVGAAVYECNGKPFVAYMTRLTKDSLKAVEANGGKLPPATSTSRLRQEYKKVGDTTWHDIDGNYAEMARYLDMKCPNPGDKMVQVSP